MTAENSLHVVEGGDHSLIVRRDASKLQVKARRSRSAHPAAISQFVDGSVRRWRKPTHNTGSFVLQPLGFKNDPTASILTTPCDPPGKVNV